MDKAYRKLKDQKKIDENLLALDVILSNNEEWVKIFKDMLSNDEFDFFMNRINNKISIKNFSQASLSTWYQNQY